MDACGFLAALCEAYGPVGAHRAPSIAISDDESADDESAEFQL